MSDTTTEGQSSFQRTGGGDFPANQPPLDLGALEERLRRTAFLLAENRKVAEYGPGSGNIKAKQEDHIEWTAANAVALLREALGIVRCTGSHTMNHKPTIHELEDILKEGEDPQIEICPGGEVRVFGENCAPPYLCPSCALLAKVKL